MRHSGLGPFEKEKALRQSDLGHIQTEAERQAHRDAEGKESGEKEERGKGREVEGRGGGEQRGRERDSLKCCSGS